MIKSILILNLSTNLNFLLFDANELVLNITCLEFLSRSKSILILSSGAIQTRGAEALSPVLSPTSPTSDTEHTTGTNNTNITNAQVFYFFRRKFCVLIQPHPYKSKLYKGGVNNRQYILGIFIFIILQQKFSFNSFPSCLNQRNEICFLFTRDT